MKGLLFGSFDVGQGGPGGFIHFCRKWCVEYKGNKYHFSQEVCELRTEYQVKPCDGSCKEDIPLDVEKVFLEKVQGSQNP